MGTVGSWGLRYWHCGRQWSCRRFVDFVISCSWSCWTVDELTNLALLTSQNFSFKIQVLCFRKEFVRNCGDEYDNLNFMNLKIDSFKNRKNSWILRSFKIYKIRFELSIYDLRASTCIYCQFLILINTLNWYAPRYCFLLVLNNPVWNFTHFST